MLPNQLTKSGWVSGRLSIEQVVVQAIVSPDPYMGLYHSSVLFELFPKMQIPFQTNNPMRLNIGNTNVTQPPFFISDTINDIRRNFQVTITHGVNCDGDGNVQYTRLGMVTGKAGVQVDYYENPSVRPIMYEWIEVNFQASGFIRVQGTILPQITINNTRRFDSIDDLYVDVFKSIDYGLYGLPSRIGINAYTPFIYAISMNNVDLINSYLFRLGTKISENFDPLTGISVTVYENLNIDDTGYYFSGLGWGISRTTITAKQTLYKSSDSITLTHIDIGLPTNQYTALTDEKLLYVPDFENGDEIDMKFDISYSPDDIFQIPIQVPFKLTFDSDATRFQPEIAT